MIEFKRDPETGILYAYEDGKLVGPVITMGDEILGHGEEADRPDTQRS